MSLPRRHRFRAGADANDLFRRLPSGARFRFSPPGGPDVFGADPVCTLTPWSTGDASPLLASALRDALPRVPPTTRGNVPAFPGGAVGIVPYEAGYALEALPVHPGPESAPWFAVYDTFARYHAPTDRVEVVSWGLLDGGEFDEREALRRAGELEERLRVGSASTSRGVPLACDAPPAPVDVRCSLDAHHHALAVERIQEHIRRGDIYQANLTARFDVTTDLPALDLYERLLRENPAPFATYLETDRSVVVSCSPERFLAAQGRELLSEPIKGTAPRGADAAEDTLRARALLASGKDRAELLMITDLVRNDLGKVSAAGSVRVPHLRRVRSFPHLHHLVSTIRGTLRPGRDVLDGLVALFPCGSITGAPKRRAMEILRELEGVPRGVYTGAIGWIGFDRSADFGVAIRTGRLADGVFSFGAGGGIVIDSEPAAEWQELLLKSRALQLALGCPVSDVRERSV